MELTRLLALARLTPAQALEVSAGVLGLLLRQPVPERAGDEDRIAGRVVVTGDGGVLLAAGDRSAGAAAGAVLAGVLAAARLPEPAADADPLQAELERAVDELPTAGLPGVAQRVQAAAAEIDRPAVRAEIGVLVRAVAPVLGSGGGAARVAAARPATRPLPGGDAPAAGSAGRRIGAWVLSLLVLAGVVTLEVAFLRDDIAADIDLLMDAGRSGADPDRDQGPEEPPLPTPGPPAAGAVTGLDLRPLAECAPEAPCTLRLLVRVVPGGEPQTVTWTYHVVDRCTGAVTSAPGGTVSVPPQADRVAAIGVVQLPAARAVAVSAVTGAPAVAASPPVVAGSCTSGDGG
ncbi:hypothetical protein [Trujillonella endophytica]|uniref:hypothetical protein n=1 Tax=Trujillonella endophytica TaxID=673521 RepID=UPI000B89E89F|nr:hypothetical protein [Trujillella endophytica]